MLKDVRRLIIAYLDKGSSLNEDELVAAKQFLDKMLQEFLGVATHANAMAVDSHASKRHLLCANTHYYAFMRLM